MATKIQGDYFGESGKLFSLYIKTALLTLLTLGIYRFWAKTRIRKYVWSAVSGDGDSFEYTGTGLEKFLGFLVAIVILAIYLGFVQMLLFFLGFNMFVEPTSVTQMFAQLAAIYITFFAVLPLLLFAEYRARRYKMARTRWRGIRLGMENGAWGYAFRALGYYFLVIITLGILTPLATFKLEKYMFDRSWYGDAKFVQNGRWQSLYPGMKYILLGILILIAGAALGYVIDSETIGGIAVVVGYILFFLGGFYYQIFSLNYLTGEKLLDGKVGFSLTARPASVIGIVVVGVLAIGLFFAIIAAIISGAFYAMGESFQNGSVPLASMIVVVVLYAVAMLVMGGLSLILITQPIIKHLVENVTVLNAEHLDTISQRAADAGADAEGFADALDVGGAL